MKNIKRKIFQIILTVFMVFSSCFLTSTVEAVDDTGSASTTSSGYFEKNIYAENTEVLDGDKGEKPNFTPSSSNKGSDINFEEGETEGQVWINKKVEVIDSNTGIFKITFQALGFKYRNVNGQNEKEDVWKNPLKAETSLEISEQIDENFHLIRDDANYEMGISDSIVGLNKNEIQFNGIKSETEPDTVVMKFDADDVTCSSDKSEGVAFDVEASFYVQVNSDVDAGTYDTEDANSSFEPATDNFYYYEWGSHEIEKKYTIANINWHNGSSNPDMTSFHYIDDIEVPVFGMESTIKFTAWSSSNGYKGSHPVSTDSQLAPNTYEVESGSNLIDNSLYYRLDVKNNLDDYNWYDEDIGIDKLYFYYYRDSNNYVYMAIEIQYSDKSWLVFKPEMDLHHGGGNTTDLPLQVYSIINKSNPVWRDTNDKTPGIVEEQFINHDQIVLKTVSVDDVKTKKTASLVNWDKRTYSIDLYAASNLEQQAQPVDIMFALDFSGSMPWLMSAPSETIEFDMLKQYEDDYSIHQKDVNRTMGTIKKWQSFEYFVLDDGEYKPIGYFDEDNCPTEDEIGEDDINKKFGEGWYALKSQGPGSDKYHEGQIIYDATLKIDKNTTIYEKGTSMTKLDMLLEQVQSFIDSLSESSSESRVGFTVFAGKQIGTTKTLTKVTELQTNGLMNYVKDFTLQGKTSQGEGIEAARIELSKSVNLNKYIILFTDGNEEKLNTAISANTAANNAKNDGIKIYTIGLANDELIGDMEKNLIEWSSNDKDTTGYYHPAKNYLEFQNAFKSIFDDLVGSIKNVIITDIIDERFYITETEKQRLEKLGVTVNGNIITWTIPELVYSENVENGSHLIINPNYS